MKDEKSEDKISLDQEKDERMDHRHEGRGKDPLRGLLPGLILILLGSLLFLTTRGTLSWATWWQYFLIGLGVIFLVDALAHYFTPKYRDASYGKFIPGIILLFIGIAFVYGFSQWWPLVLVAAGIIILINVLFRRR